MLQELGSQAFDFCDQLKMVVATALDPKSLPIYDQTFYTNTFRTGTLYVPYDEETGWDATYWAYYWDTQWGQFYDIKKGTYDYKNIGLNDDYIQDKGTIPGEDIEAEFGPNAGYVVEEEAEQALDTVHVQQNDQQGGSIIADGNLDINTLISEIQVVANRWYFFCFPFDVKLADIQAPGQYAWRYYNAEKRANNGFGAWTNVPKDTEYLTAGQGYIFRTNKAGTLVLSIEKPDFDADGKSPELETHASDNAQDASWNFVGNPYLCYYNIDNLVEFDAPLTIWNGSGYEAVRPGDDDYELQPYQAFFVQKPVGKNSVNFDKDARETYQQSLKNAANVKSEMRMKKNPNRLLVNLTLHKGEEQMDKTRVVFNNEKSLSYEMDCDAAKFISEDCDIQMYTSDAAHTCYAINERPVESGTVALTIQAKSAGTYMLKAPRMDTPMLLVDTQKGITHDLETGGYEFETETGTFSERFILKLKNTPATGVEGIEGTESETSTYYNIAGQQTNGSSKGIRIQKKGQKATKVLNR